MSSNNSSRRPGSDGARKFPSRREIHGTWIPKTPGTEQEKDVAPTQEPADVPTTEEPAGKSMRASTATSPELGAKHPVGDRPFPTRSSRHRKSKRDSAQVSPPQPTSTRQPQAPVRRPEPQTAIPARTAVPARTTGPVATAGAAAPPVAARRVASEPTRRKSNRKRSLIRGLILLGLLALVILAVWWAWTSISGVGGSDTTTESIDYPGPGSGSVEVTISPGETGADIGATLHDADVVKTVEAFTRAFNANSASATIRPGTYSLMLQMSAAGALAALLDESNREGNAITVTPGQAVDQIAERLVGVAGFTEEDVESALEDTAALGLPEVAEGNPEGWLAAGTYEVTVGDTPAVVLSEMVAAMRTVLTDLGVAESDWQETLIKASILEREVIGHTDLAKVARVIENRLNKPDAETVGLLQMDSTVLYGVGKYGGIPNADDLADDNPYNTYRVQGLPPAPIATPSVEAIEATLNPEDGDWLYFVTVNLDTGETLFASTLEEQMENQELLDEWCMENEGRC